MTAAKTWMSVMVTVSLIAATMAARPSLAAAQPQSSPEIEEIARRDLEQLASTLNDPTARQDARDEAAKRLVSRRSAAARQIVADALVRLNPPGQLAAAQALADDRDPNPAFIDPLFAALGNQPRALTEAAARALANYKDQPTVVIRMIDFVERRSASEGSRVAVIRALGQLPQKRSAEFLVSLLARANESPGVHSAASEALADMTGMSNGDESGPRQWIDWWAENRDKSEIQFRADLLAPRAARDDSTRARFEEMGIAFDNFLLEQYRNTPAAQRPELLLHYLRSSQPHARAVAARIVMEEALDNKAPAPQVREQLRTMIGDSSPLVRAAAAEALSRINDAGALEALLAQLSQEPNASVRASLALALAPINDLRAVPVLIEMLRDPSEDAAQAAARALRQLGPIIYQRDPALAARSGAALREALQSRAVGPNNAELRQLIVAAMIPLRQEELRPLLTNMMQERRGETLEVRYLVIRAIGEIANPESAGLLVAALQDRSERVRFEAVNALAKSPALAEYALDLRPLIDPATEPDETVRLAAWRALEKVLPSLPKAQLVIWAERLKEDPARRLVALKALAAQQVRDKDEDDLATTRMDIGAVLVKQREYKEAAEYFGMALDYKKTQRVPGAVIDALVRERLKALLLDRDFNGVTQFASQSIAENPANAQEVGTMIWNEAQRLTDAGDLQTALDLISAVNRMSPPLAEEHRTRLAEVEKQLQQRRNQRNGVTPPPLNVIEGSEAVPANDRSVRRN